MVTRAILLVVLVSLLVIGVVRADQPKSSNGSITKADDEIEKANTVFVGVITDFGPVALKGPGHSVLRGVKVNVLQVLRGAVGAKVSLTIDIENGRSSSKMPPGEACIFVVRKILVPDPAPYIAYQLFPATDDNIAMVKKLISN